MLRHAAQSKFSKAGVGAGWGATPLQASKWPWACARHSWGSGRRGFRSRPCYVHGLSCVTLSSFGLARVCRMQHRVCETQAGSPGQLPECQDGSACESLARSVAAIPRFLDGQLTRFCGLHSGANKNRLLSLWQCSPVCAWLQMRHSPHIHWLVQIATAFISSYWSLGAAISTGGAGRTARSK